MAQAVGSNNRIDENHENQNSTRNELDWLRNIIGNQNKQIVVDNINHDEKTKKNERSAFDVSADELFDNFMIIEKNNIKDILNKVQTPSEKRQAIKDMFNKFMQQIKNGDMLDKKYEKLEGKINIFKTLEAQKAAEGITTLDLYNLELQKLSDDVLGPVDVGGDNNNKKYKIYNGGDAEVTPSGVIVSNYTEYKEAEKNTDQEIGKNYREEEKTQTKDNSEAIKSQETKNTYKSVETFATNNTLSLYDADTYIDGGLDDTENDINENKERKALKRILYGKKVFLRIVDQDYEVTGIEKDLLKGLFKTIKDIGEDGFHAAITQAESRYFKEGPLLDQKKAKKTADKLFFYYSMANKPSTDFPYFSRALLLLTKEFKEDPDTSFVKIYNKINDMPTKRSLKLATGKKRIAYKVLKENSDHLDKATAKKLFKRNQKLNINEVIIENIKIVEKSKENGQNIAIKGRDRQETNFFKFLNKNLGNEDLKKNNLYEIFLGTKTLDNEGQKEFYKLLNSFRIGLSLQDHANAIKLNNDVKEIDDELPEAEIDDELPEAEKITKQENQVGQILSDLNRDGRSDYGDKSIRSGLQIRSFFDSSIKHIGGKKTINNFLDVALTSAKQKELVSYQKKIEEIQGIKPYKDQIKKFLETMKSDPAFVKILQRIILESPFDPDLIFGKGNEGFDHYNKMLNEFNEKEKGIIYRAIDKKLENYTLSPQLRQAIFETVAAPLIQIGKGSSSGFGFGTSADLSAILEGLSLNVGVGINEKDPAISLVGINLSWDKNIQLSKKLDLYQKAVGGLVGPAFIPVASYGAGVNMHLGQKNKKTLDVNSEKTLTLGGNVTVIGIPPVMMPSFGLTAGISIDKQQGIEKQASYIRSGTKSIVKDFLGSYSGDKQTDINKLKTILGKKFGNSDIANVEKAANNIYTALSYFGIEDQSNKADIETNKEFFADLVADFYVASRNNELIMGIDRWHFSGASIGVQFLAGFFPIPTVCVQISKYRNLYYKDTPESIKRNETAETRGFGNEFLATKNPEDTKEKLNKFLPTDEKYKITIDEDGYFEIPAGLVNIKNVNININSNLKGTLKITTKDDGTKIIKVPANIPVRYMERTQGASQMHVLNLGSTETNPKDDLQLRPGFEIPKEWIGDKIIESYEKEIEGLENKLNKQIQDLQTRYPLFPIGKAIIKDGKVTYYDRSNPNNFILKLKDIPIEKNVSINIDSDNSLTVNYADNVYGKHILEYSENARIETKNYSLDEIELPKNPQKNNVSTLAEELKQRDQIRDHDFTKFLENGISSENINETAINLGNLLDKIGTTDITKKTAITELKTELLNANNEYDKMLIINHAKIIFADNGNNRFFENRGLSNYIKNRDAWKEISGPSRDKPLNAFSRYKNEAIKGDKKWDIGDKPVFGYTARYRQGADNKARNRSMTLPGKTTILKKDGKTYATEIKADDSNIIDSKKRFLDNFEHDTQEQKLLQKTFKKLLEKNKNIPGELLDKLNRKEIRSLLEGETITIDKTKKKYSINLESKWIFYLLTECANESQGFVPEKLNIKEVSDKPDVKEEIYLDVPKSGLTVNFDGTTSAARHATRKTLSGAAVGVKANPKDRETNTEVIEETGTETDVVVEDLKNDFIGGGAPGSVESEIIKGEGKYDNKLNGGVMFGAEKKDTRKK